MGAQLKAPFPWFGGKSKVAGLIWERFGDVNNLIVPFTGSAALELADPAWEFNGLGVLLCRRSPPRVESINDLDCYVANFWRATQHNPDAVAEFADWPVNEADLHARHRWLVLGSSSPSPSATTPYLHALSRESALESNAAREFRERMRTDPHYYDARIAGWWCWGLCCWIGGGWCAVPGETAGEIGCLQERRPLIAAPESQGGNGVHRVADKMPKLSGETSVSAGTNGMGVHAQGPCTYKRRPKEKPCGISQRGEHARPQLADAYSRGRGVHGNDDAGTCAQRRAWLLDWFAALRDRLRTVRVCCGDWSRVCNSPSVTVRLGMTGVFLDPPYGALAGRDPGLYATDSLTVAEDVRRWCQEWGPHPSMRIALCGYEGEGHEELEGAGWECVAWKAHGGYGNRSEAGKANAARERIWFSPHCYRQRGLFDMIETEA